MTLLIATTQADIDQATRNAHTCIEASFNYNMYCMWVDQFNYTDAKFTVLSAKDYDLLNTNPEDLAY